MTSRWLNLFRMGRRSMLAWCSPPLKASYSAFLSSYQAAKESSSLYKKSPTALAKR